LIHFETEMVSVGLPRGYRIVTVTLSECGEYHTPAKKIRRAITTRRLGNFCRVTREWTEEVYVDFAQQR
jgi:hypothetical protein